MWTKLRVILPIFIPIILAFAVWRAFGDRPVENLAAAVLFGFLAGSVLNVMPCVLPVVGIKIHGLLQQPDRSPSQIRAQGLAFAAGIVCTFIALGALAAFAGLGWGQAFQSDAFLITLIALLVVFALGAFDIYSIRVPAFITRSATDGARTDGLAGSFMTGVLATILATPCGAPLLGATLSWGLRQSPALTLVIFTAIGAGMAFPYAVLSCQPHWLRWVPRSGAWTESVRQFLGFLILGTAVWLLWQRRLDGELVVQTVAFVLTVSLATWIYGRWSQPISSPAERLYAPVAAGFVVGFGAWFCFGLMSVSMDVRDGVAPPVATADSYESRQGSVAWRPYSRGALDEQLAAGASVLVMWTADWCPTCLMVGQFVLDDRQVRATLVEKKIVTMKADVTRYNEAAQELMIQLDHQARTIPYFALFSAGDPEHPRTHASLFTKQDMLEFIRSD